MRFMRTHQHESLEEILICVQELLKIGRLQRDGDTAAGKNRFRNLILIKSPQSGVTVFSSFPPRPLAPPQQLLPLASKLFELNLR